MTRLVIGVGFRDQASARSIDDAITAALQRAPKETLTMIAVPADKAQHPALLTAARARSLPIIAVDAEQVGAAGPKVTTSSAASWSHRGVGSVCEAAALAAAGHGAELAVSRVVSPDRHATAAIARFEETSA